MRPSAMLEHLAGAWPRSCCRSRAIEQVGRDGRIASVCGRTPRIGGERRQPENRPGQGGASRAAPASISAAGSPRSRPSESTTTSAPRAKEAKRGTDRKACSASPSRVPPSQSATNVEASASAWSRLRAFSARVTRVSRVPSGEHLEALGRAHRAWANRSLALGCGFHRAGDVDEQEDAPLARGARRPAGARPRRRGARRVARSAGACRWPLPRARAPRREARRRGDRAGAARWKRRSASLADAGEARMVSSSAPVASAPASRSSSASGGSMAPSRSSKACSSSSSGSRSRRRGQRLPEESACGTARRRRRGARAGCASVATAAR